ncbi:AAA family ATPase [Actinoplanes sp. NPDC049596]|uniref:AAA family ATPase n=1 Tax=unclassified Actinoplanes TaxID=2626549 RepID=UPI0034468123
MIGRQPEFEELRRVVEAGSGSPRALFLFGAAGIGKSTLLDAARAHAEQSGLTVLSCAGLQSDMPVGYADLHALLYPVLHLTPRLPDRQRHALAGAFGWSELGGDPLLIRLAVLGLLEQAAIGQRIALVVDDWQWLDPSTQAVLSFVVKHLLGTGVVLLAAARVDDGEFFAAPGGRATHVQPLGRSDAEALVARLGKPLAPRERDLVVRFGQGNPLALNEFAKAARAGDLRENSVLFPERLPITARLERAFACEVGSLPETTRRVLLLAVAGVDVGVAELLMAAATVGADAADLEILEKTGLLSTAGGRLRFRHPLVRSTVYARASTNERITAHRTLATVVSDRARRAWHRAGAAVGRDDDIAEELANAAGDLERRGALAEAAAALSRAAELSTDVVHRARRLVAAAEQARRAGLTSLADALVDQARPLTDDPVVQLILHTVHSWTATFSAASRPDLRPFVDFARVLAARDVDEYDEEQLKLLWPMGPLVWLYHGSGQVVQDAIEQILAISTPQWTPWKGLLLLMLDPVRFAREMQPKVAELLAAWERDSAALPLNFAHALSAIQRVTVATGIHERTRDILRNGGSLADEARHEVALATARVVTGEPRTALAAAEVGARISEALDLSMQAAAGHAVQALAHAWLGDVAASRAAFEASERAAPAAWPIVEAHRQWAAGLLALGERRYRDGWEHLEQTSSHRTTHLWAIADLAEAAANADMAAAGHEVLSELERDVKAFDSPELNALYQRGRALLDNSPHAESHFQRSLAEGHRSGVRLQQARTHLAYGRWLRLERRIIDSRVHLREARRLFDVAGASLWSEQAVSELRASGILANRRPVHASEDNNLDALTDQERRIATLAARGLSNKEIANHLFMSPRTVGSHLYRIFPKLHVTRRAQLRDALGAVHRAERAAG